MLAARVIRGSFGHKMDRDGPARPAAVVLARAVPGERVVKVHVTFLHRAHDQVQRVAFEFFRKLAALRQYGWMIVVK